MITVRHRVAHAARSFRKALRSQAGAFDLPSIIVGVVVVAILAAGVLAAVFGVIPFSQDKSAQQDLDSVRTAQGVAKTRFDGYKDKAGLLSGGLISDRHSLGVATDSKGSCFVGISKSDSGNVYFNTDKTTEPALLSAGQDTGCIDGTTRDTIVNGIGGYGPGSSTPVADGTGGTVTGGSGSTGTTGGASAVSYNLAGWGENGSGMLGVGNQNEVVDATAIGPMKFTKISAGVQSTCGISDGKAYCWGAASLGRLGVGSSVQASDPNGYGVYLTTPTAVDTSGVLAGKTITDIGSGTYHTCVIADGAPYCWGYNLYSQVNGIPGSDSAYFSPVAVDTSGVLAGKTLKSIVGGGANTCALDTVGQAYCWGDTQALGNGVDRASMGTVSAPVAVVMNGTSFTSISGTYSHYCAIDTSGTAYCWGLNASGQLGIGSANTSYRAEAPAAVVGLPTAVTSITVGDEHSCAIAGGAAYCWGANWSDQLGNGTGTNSSTAVPVDTSGVLNGVTLTMIASSGDSDAPCAASADAVYCWGDGYVGNGMSWSANPTPVQVTGAVTGVAVEQLVDAGNYNTNLFLYS